MPLFKTTNIWLVDHFSYKPPDGYRLTRKDVDETGITHLTNSPFNRGATEEERKRLEAETHQTHEFLNRVWEKSGLSENMTHVPPSIHPRYCGSKPKTDLKSAYDECHESMCGAVGGLLMKTGLAPEQVDILITTCSIYCPTPSMCAMIINHFKMRPDIQSYHLGGMGCSNGVVGIALARDMLKAWPNCNVVFATSETCTPAFYTGRDRARLVPNMLFRMGASAVLLSNKSTWVPKYRLVHSYRICTAARDDSYRCIWYGPDDEGINGVALSKEVVTEASFAVTRAMKSVAPYIMTWTQIFRFIMVSLQRRVAKAQGRSPPAVQNPAFNEGVQHFLLHAGGAKVLEGLGKALKLKEHDLEPSRAVLHDYGNVSSSTTWYALGFIETMQGVKAGDKVLQVGVGSGIKCGVNVWKAERAFSDKHAAWLRRLSPEDQPPPTTFNHPHNRRTAPWQVIGKMGLAMLLCVLCALWCLWVFVLAGTTGLSVSLPSKSGLSVWSAVHLAKGVVTGEL